MRAKKASMQHSSFARALARQAALGVALGLGFCLLVVLINPSQIT